MENVNKLLWLTQRITAFLLVAFLVFHLWMFHYDSLGTSAINYEAVFGRFTSPVWFLFYSFFGITLVIHIFIGIRNIVLDFKPKSNIFKIGDIFNDLRLNFYPVSISSFVSRFSGIFLVGFFAFHTLVVTSVFWYPEFFNLVIGASESLVGRFIEYGVVVLGLAHGLNNLRTMALDFFGLARIQGMLLWIFIGLFLIASILSAPIFFGV